MSPMFLGGLTARACKLKNELLSDSITLKETYPAEHAQNLGLKELGYKKGVDNISICLSKIQDLLPGEIDGQSVNSWHDFDALLALISSFHHDQGIHQEIGDSEEGVIIL